MSQSSSPPSTPLHPVAVIEYNYLRQQILTLRIPDLASQTAARAWAISFRDHWTDLVSHGRDVGTDPTEDVDIQHFLSGLRSGLVPFITSEWVDLAPAIVGRLLPAARALPPGQSLMDSYGAVPAAGSPPPRTAAAPAPLPPVPTLALASPATLEATASASPATRSPSTGSLFSQVLPPSSRALSSDHVRPQLTLRDPEVGPPRALAPTETIVQPAHPRDPLPDSETLASVSPAAGTTAGRPAKRAKAASKDPSRVPVPPDSELMPKKRLPRGYTSCLRCHDIKKRCAPLRDAVLPYDVCGRCLYANERCIRPSKEGTVPFFAPGRAGTSRYRSLSPSVPSVVAISPGLPSTPDYTRDQEVVLGDGFPLRAPHHFRVETDRASLSDLFALSAEADVASVNALKGFAAVRAAYAEARSLKVRYEAACAATNAAQSILQLDVNRRLQAWKTLESLLGADEIHSATSDSEPASRLSVRGRKGKGKRSAAELDDGDGDGDDDYVEEVEDAEEVSGVGGMGD